MTEEPEQPFPPPEEVVVNHTEADEEQPSQPQTKISEPIIEEPEETEEVEAAIVISSSTTGSDGETTGPSTAENSVSQALPTEEPKQVVGGRASIPDELEPHQLACLQNLKESNA